MIFDIEYANSKNQTSMEFAVIDLQKQLPQNIKIKCCQNFRHGNFCPYGNNDDEIFCLKNYNPVDKMDVAGIFTNDVIATNTNTVLKYPVIPHKLLHWCEKHEFISKVYYTYNDWIYYVDERTN